MLLSSPKNNRQGRALRSPVTGRAWLDTGIPPTRAGPDAAPHGSPGCRAACLPQPLAGAGGEQGLFQEGKEQPEPFPEGPAGLPTASCSRARGGPGWSPGARLHAWESSAPAQTDTAWGRDRQHRGDTHSPDQAPIFSSKMLPWSPWGPASTPPFTTPRKAAAWVQTWMQTLEHLPCSQGKQFDKGDVCHIPLALRAQPQQRARPGTTSASTLARQGGPPRQSLPQSRSRSQRRCPCVTDGGAGTQPAQMLSGRQDTSTLTPRRCPVCPSPAGRTDRRDRVAHSPASPWQLLQLSLEKCFI